jgi:uncharacterized protein (TIGR02453 family)
MARGAIRSIAVESRCLIASRGFGGGETIMGKEAAIFAPETFRFFHELGRNNHKPWMDENRERYRAQVVEPFHALLDRLAPSVNRLDQNFLISGRTGENFSRINRDIRFAKDKSPYRTHLYLFFSRQGIEAGEAQLYVGVSLDAVTAGFRAYVGSRRSPLARLRISRAKEHAGWLARQRRRLGKRFESYWYSSEHGEWTKKTGWPSKPEEWKRLKGWIVRRKFKPAAATRPAFAKVVEKIFRELFPLYQFASSEKWKP